MRIAVASDHAGFRMKALVSRHLQAAGHPVDDLGTDSAEPVDSLTMIAGVRGYEPPEGTMLFSGTMALLRSNGLVVTIHAPEGEVAIEVARSLRPYTAPAAR